MKKYLFLLLFLFLPLTSFATTHYYETCTGWSVPAGCSIDENGVVLTFNSSDINQYLITDFLSQGTWYVSVVYNGSGAVRLGSGAGDFYWFSDSLVNYEWEIGDTNQNGYYTHDTFTGTLSSFCITDVSGECEKEISGSVSTSTDLSADGTSVAIAMGFFLFIIVLFLVINYFKR